MQPTRHSLINAVTLHFKRVGELKGNVFSETLQQQFESPTINGCALKNEFRSFDVARSYDARFVAAVRQHS